MQILDQAEPNEKSNAFEKEASEPNAKIDFGEMEQFELIKDVSTNKAIVSDGNETDSSFSEIDIENEVINNFFKVTYYKYINILILGGTSWLFHQNFETT